MKIIKPKAELIPQKDGLEGVYEIIEKAGRTCYCSDHLIGKNPSKDFVERMALLGHGAMLEHGTIYLSIDIFYGTGAENVSKKYKSNIYSKVSSSPLGLHMRTDHVTTNLRVLYQGDYDSWDEAVKNKYDKNWLDDFKYICKPTVFHDKRLTAIFHTDRITGESFLRHRAINESHTELHFAVEQQVERNINSYARQSTRYCNFDKKKFGNTITFVKPEMVTFDYKEDVIYKKQDIIGNTEAECEWMRSCLDSEEHYFKLLKLEWTPENARYALGFSIYSPLVMTAFMSDWYNFFELRDSKHAHPDARYLAHELKELFIKEGFID